MNEKIIIQERGWPAHFCDALKCTFRRNTLITLGELRAIVSTVGNYCPISLKDGPRELSIGRYYETVAFWAEKRGGYWEIDIKRQISFSGNDGVYAKSKTDLPEHVDNDANQIHDDVVREVAAILEREAYPFDLR